MKRYIKVKMVCISCSVVALQRLTKWKQSANSTQSWVFLFSYFHVSACCSADCCAKRLSGCLLTVWLTWFHKRSLGLLCWLMLTLQRCEFFTLLIWFRETVFVCVLIHTGMSHSSVSHLWLYKAEDSSTSQKLKKKKKKDKKKRKLTFQRETSRYIDIHTR